MRAHRIGFCFIGFCLLSCTDASQPELAEILEVGPDAVEPGDHIEILGRGFVEGPATVTLEGDVKSLGLGSSEPRHVVLRGKATSENRVEVSLSTQVMKRIVEEPSRFFGGVAVSFPVLEGSVRIFAVKSGVTMDFRPGGAGVVLAAKRAREAGRFLGDLGLRLHDSRDAGGLVVREVKSNSLAQAAGFEFGDRLLTVDGAPVSSTADLGALGEAKQHRFEVISRTGTVRHLSVRSPGAYCVDRDELTAILLSSIAFGFFIALVAPKRRRWDFFRHRRTDPFTKALGFGVVSLLLILVPAATVLLDNSTWVSVGLLGVNALGLAMVFILAESKQRSAVATLFALLLVPAFVVVSGYLSSAAGLNEIVAAQKNSGIPMHAVAGPFPLLVVLSSLFLMWPVQPAKPAWQKLSTTAVWMTASSAAAALAACMLGGWRVPFVDDSGGGALFALGCLFFLGKTWLIILTAKWLTSFDTFDRRAVRRVRRPWRATAIMLVSTAAAVAWTVWEPLREFRSAGQVLATAMFIAIVTALLVSGARALIFGPSLPKNSRYVGLTPPVQAK